MDVLAFDIGSSSTRAAMFDERGQLCRPLFARRYALGCNETGAAELDPQLLRTAVRAGMAHLESSRCNILAISSFWHGLLGLDAKLRPLTPIYTWADSRSTADAAQLRAEFSEEAILQRTGCMLRFPFWPAKLRWLRRTNRGLFRRARFWVSPGDWILHDLFGELATSASMASGTGLFDQVTRKWHRELCDGAGIDQAQLPPVRRAVTDDGGILTAIGDGAASNIGSGAIFENIAAINLGTSAAVRMMTRRHLPVPNGLFRFVASSQTFVLGGATSNAGNLREWCHRKLHISRSVPLERKLAATDRLTALPFLVAERAPDWPEFPGAVSGYTLSTTPLEVFRALITAALYRIADIFDLLEQLVGRIDRIVISGGMTRSSDTIGILADALGRDLEIASETEASLRGAALHALARGGEFPPAHKHGRIIRFNKDSADLHRARREKQRLFSTASSSHESFSIRSKRGRTLA